MDVGSTSHLGARHFEGTFSLRKRGHFLKVKQHKQEISF